MPLEQVAGAHITQIRMTGYLFLACIVGACTGLLFGYDLAVAGGVAAMASFQRMYFPHLVDQQQPSVSTYCKFSDPFLQLFVSSIFLTGIVGAVIGSWVCRVFGRKYAMAAGGCCFVAGSVTMATSTHFVALLAGRLCMGLGIGAVVQSGPLFLAEIAPARLRGRLSFMFQLFVTLGLLAAQVVNYALRDLEVGWRVALGIEALLGMVLAFGALAGPDSPVSLAQRGRLAECHATLARLRGHDARSEVALLTQACSHAGGSGWRLLLTSRPLKPQLLLTIFFAAANQLNLINGVVFFMPQLMQSVGRGRDMALLATVLIGSVNVVATVVAVLVVDRLGRRLLLQATTLAAACCLACMGALLLVFLPGGNGGSMPAGPTFGFVGVACAFIVSHAIGIGPLAWLLCSEIHPAQTRAAGAGLAVVVNFAFSFAVGQAFLTLLCHLQAWLFVVFAGLQLAILAVHVFLVPETRGADLARVCDVFAAHKVWARYSCGGPELLPQTQQACSSSAAAAEGVGSRDGGTGARAGS